MVLFLTLRRQRDVWKQSCRQTTSDRNQLGWRERANKDSRSRLEPSDRYHKFHSEKSSSKWKVHKAISTVKDLSDLLPLGLASAVTIKARVTLQDIWRSKQFDWDDPLPEEMKSLCTHLFADMEKLRCVKFPQCLKPTTTTGPSQLHVFTSINAYGAVAYLLWPTQDGAKVRLISAKARAAPLH